MAQYAIIKQKTKAQAASNYLGNIANDESNLYFFFGNPVPWNIVPGGDNNETTPPAPVDTALEEKRVWDNMIGLKKLSESDIRLGFRRVNWVSGQYYDMYRDDFDGTVDGVTTTGSTTKPISLSRSNNVVLVNDSGVYRLYRCLDNRSTSTGYPVASTTMPTFTSTQPQTLADGYVWKYLGSLSTLDVEQYLTTQHCPVPSTLSTGSNDGAALSVVITSRGAGYTSNPTITVQGDGTGMAFGTPVLVGGGLAYVPITNRGTGYTYATITISGGGTPTTTATAKVILAPAGGIGSNFLDEVEPNFLIIKAENSNTDQYFTTRGNAPRVYDTELSYRTVGLIENPKKYDLDELATASLLRPFSEYRYAATLGQLSYGDLLTSQTSGLLKPVGVSVGVRSDTSYIADTVTFNAVSSVDETAHTITFVGHGLLTGDAVLYNSNGGTPVGGLTNGVTYYAIKVDVDTFKLASSQNNAFSNSAIAITDGIGSNHTLKLTVPKLYVSGIQTLEQKVEGYPFYANSLLTTPDSSKSITIGPVITFNGGSGSVVSVSANTIKLNNHPFATGDYVTYTTSGTTIQGMVSGTSYYVIRVDSNTIRLATSLANANNSVAVDITGLGTGTSHKLTYIGSDAIDPPTVEKYSGRIIFVENRNALTRSTNKETFRFVLEF
jgi:hypothetical protein